MNNGWIKLHRKILSSDMYQSLNSKQRDILITLLLMANHKEKQWEYKSEIYTAKPGQMVTSLESIKKNCAKDVTIQNIRTTLKKLETWGFLTNQSTKTGRLITIVNWRLYQDEETETNKDDNKELTKNQQRANKELTTNKNDKRMIKNDKEDKEPTKSKRKQENLCSKEDIESFVGRQIAANDLGVNRKLLVNYINTLRLTRKTGRISINIIQQLWDKWSKYHQDVVTYAMWVHIDKHDDKREEYTLGIMRGTKEHEARRKLIWMKNKNGGEMNEANRYSGIGHDQREDTSDPLEDVIKDGYYRNIPGLFADV